MNTPLTYTPAYIGLFASMWLALVCNSFLDIQYGGFGFEVFFWAAVQAWTIRVAWLQQGVTSESGRQKQKIILFVGLLLFVVAFFPMWGFPRAGLYLLAMLQASQNCVTTTRRQLYLGLLVSAVMVMFAASHHRADWTMLFYLLPYIIAVVCTLVSEQVSRRAQSIRESSLKDTGRTGQGIAIAAATSIILGLAGLFYFTTPQVTWPYLSSKYGQLSNLGWFGESPVEESRAQSGNRPGKGSGEQESSPRPDNSGDGNKDSQEYSRSPWSGWPTAGQMREAAVRPGMPGWQSTAIGKMADLSEAISQALVPIAEAIENLIDQLQDWLEKNRNTVVAALLTFILLMLLIALAFLLHEVKARTWLRTRFDYWYLVALGQHASGRDGAIQFYRAMERLFLLADMPRAKTTNTREFLWEATYLRDDIRPAATELTLIFERYRYAQHEPATDQIARMKHLYRNIFRCKD